MSASVRWPYFLTSSLVIIVTDDGASVVFCLYLDAASTVGISIFTNSSKLMSVGDAGGAAADSFPAAGAEAVKKTRAARPKTTEAPGHSRRAADCRWISRRRKRRQQDFFTRVVLQKRVADCLERSKVPRKHPAFSSTVRRDRAARGCVAQEPKRGCPASNIRTSGSALQKPGGLPGAVRLDQ